MSLEKKKKRQSKIKNRKREKKFCSSNCLLLEAGWEIKYEWFLMKKESYVCGRPGNNLLKFRMSIDKWVSWSSCSSKTFWMSLLLQLSYSYFHLVHCVPFGDELLEALLFTSCLYTAAKFPSFFGSKLQNSSSQKKFNFISQSKENEFRSMAENNVLILVGLN